MWIDLQQTRPQLLRWQTFTHNGLSSEMLRNRSRSTRILSWICMTPKALGWMPCWPNWPAWRRSWRISIGSSRPSSSKRVDLSWMRPYPIRTMKTILALVALSTLFLSGCVSGGSYTYSSYTTGRYSNAYVPGGYSYPTRPYQQIRRETYFVGPQYYKVYDDRCGNIQYKNYTDAPVVVNQSRGSTMIIPRSWDWPVLTELW